MTDTDNGESAWFDAERRFHETFYLRGTNPRQQSGFGRDERDWERFRRPVVAGLRKNGTFLDIGCASGLLMEDVTQCARNDGYAIEPYGVDISEKLANLARRRLPHWRDLASLGGSRSARVSVTGGRRAPQGQRAFTAAPRARRRPRDCRTGQ